MRLHTLLQQTEERLLTRALNAEAEVSKLREAAVSADAALAQVCSFIRIEQCYLCVWDGVVASLQRAFFPYQCIGQTHTHTHARTHAHVQTNILASFLLSSTDICIAMCVCVVVLFTSGRIVHFSHSRTLLCVRIHVAALPMQIAAIATNSTSSDGRNGVAPLLPQPSSHPLITPPKMKLVTLPSTEK